MEDLKLHMSHGEFLPIKDNITEETFCGGRSLLVTVTADKEDAASREFLARVACDYISCMVDPILEFELIESLEDHAFTKDDGTTVYDKCSLRLYKLQSK